EDGIRDATVTGVQTCALPIWGNDALVANVTPPRVSSASPSRPATEISASGATDLEKKVFGNRKFYSMTLNMPNLNSSGGSWVIQIGRASCRERVMIEVERRCL